MAKRSNITLSERDYELLLELKKLRKEQSTSGVIARAIQIATEIERATSDGNELYLENDSSGEKTKLKIL